MASKMLFFFYIYFGSWPRLSRFLKEKPHILSGDTNDKKDAHGPRFAHLSDIATADMQMLCNIFPILSSQLMKISSFEQFLVLKKNKWPDSQWSMIIWINYQSHFNRMINVKFGEICCGFWRIMILYM